MAEERANDAADSADSGGGLVGAIVGGLGRIWDAVTGDGFLAAMGRQGADELGAALKAFPDSIQQDEVGTLWNPTQGEIARSRDLDNSPSPSEIVAANSNQPDTGRGYDNGADAGYSM